MNTPPSFELNVIDAQSIGLRLVFDWRDDRFGHTIYRTNEAGITPLFVSVEGTSTDDWPASPPVQEIVEHKFPNGHRSLLLTGQSGKSHWSATVEAVGDSLLFDVAVRLKESPQRLGSTYESLAQEQFAASIQPAEETALATTVKQLTTSTHQLVAPQIPSPLKLPTTIRWQYRAIGVAGGTPLLFIHK